jgi:hypothetical protein
MKNTRKLGQGYSLALDTGNGTHLTLVYFHQLRRGFEQNMVKQLAENYIYENCNSEIYMRYDNVFLNEQKRCVVIKNHEIKSLQDGLQMLFYTNFSIDTTSIHAKTPHIDLRGTDYNDLSDIIVLHPPKWWI